MIDMDQRILWRRRCLCRTMEAVEQCTRQFRCSHDETRRRLEAYLWFFNWLCQNTHGAYISGSLTGFAKTHMVRISLVL